MIKKLRWTGTQLAGLGFLAVAALLPGCGNQAPPASTTRVFATDLSGGARHCDVPKVSPVAGKDIAVAMKLGNDGGWCAITVNDGGRPYGAGLLDPEPAHGKVLVHSVGDNTRIDYTPDPRFTGGDSFAVRLVPGNATLRVTVSVVGQ